MTPRGTSFRLPQLAVVLAAALVPAALGAQGRLAVDPAPLLEIGGAATDPRAVLAHPAGAVRLSDGTIVVGDLISAALLYFGPDGRLIRKVGGMGAGPGEFRHIWWMGVCGRDSVYIWDSALRRMSVADAHGRVTTLADTIIQAAGGAPLDGVSCSRDGTLAYQVFSRGQAGRGPNPGQPTVERGLSDVVIADAAGRTIGSVPRVPTSEMVVMRGGGAPRPLGRRTMVAASGERVYVATGDSATVGVYTREGRRVGSLSVPSESRPPSPTEYERAVDALVGQIHGPAAGAVRQMMLDIAPPALIPPLRALYASPGNVVWALVSAEGAPTTTLHALRPGGASLGQIVLPVALTVYEIGDDYLLGAYTAPDGEPRVVMYGIRGER